MIIENLGYERGYCPICGVEALRDAAANMVSCHKCKSKYKVLYYGTYEP